MVGRRKCGRVRRRDGVLSTTLQLDTITVHLSSITRPHHPLLLFHRALIGFAILIAALALPAIVVNVLGDLYVTAWWVPMASASGLSQWSGGLQMDGEYTEPPLS